MRVQTLVRGMLSLGVAAMLVIATNPAFAGQANLADEAVETTTEITDETETTIEIGAGEILVETTNSVETIIEEVIERTFEGIEANVSIELTLTGNNTGSPHDNIFSTTSVEQSFEAEDTGGITQIAQVQGASNVTVSTNSLFDASGFAEVVGEDGANPGGELNMGAVVGLVATPGLGLNSLYATLSLDVIAAAATAALDSPVLVFDAVAVGNDEFSPHNNIVAIDEMLQEFTLATSKGITQIAQIQGSSNVSLMSNTIMFTSDGFESDTDFFSP